MLDAEESTDQCANIRNAWVGFCVYFKRFDRIINMLHMYFKRTALKSITINEIFIQIHISSNALNNQRQMVDSFDYISVL